MAPDTTRMLTRRQRDVMERVERRIPIKVIAGELGVSATRVNQHIRALKDIYGADSLAELVEYYRRDEASAAVVVDPEGGLAGAEGGRSDMNDMAELAAIQPPSRNNAMRISFALVFVALLVLGTASLSVVYQ